MTDAPSDLRKPLTAALVNDYDLVVRGVAHMLDDYKDRVSVVELDAGTDVAEPVDIALYDSFAQAPFDAGDLADVLNNPKVRRVVVYTWNLQNDVIRIALEMGVDGYLSKTLPAEGLVKALERINAGERIVSRVQTQVEDDELVGGDWPGRAEGLTQRESEIIAHITQGLSNQQIASTCYLSINSVKSYIRSAYRKMGVASRSQAVLWGVEHGFAPDHLRRKRPELS
ncbi:MAG: response regulator transcription factor [Micrococcales bacterium]|nr:response regulator transcription factor [Micrococcales bacterium]